MDKIQKEKLKNVIQRLQEASSKKKKKGEYCSVTEDTHHLLDHSKTLCRCCYSYRDKKTDFVWSSVICKKCEEKIKKFMKKFSIGRVRAGTIIKMGYEYKKEHRIDLLKKAAVESEEAPIYDMINARVIDIREDGVTADYGRGLLINYSMEELEVLKRIRKRRIEDEFNHHKRLGDVDPAEGLFFIAKKEMKDGVGRN